jgi:DNA-binding transcriptional LysR family regulator
LPELLKKIGKKYDGLDFEIIASDEISDLTEREADIAIRMAKPTQNALLAQKIGEIEIGAYANEKYFENNTIPENIDDLARHDMIFYDALSPFLIPFTQEFPIIESTHFKYRAASPAVQLSLILKGVGIGFCQAGIANEYGLKRILKDEINIKIPAYIAMHENLKNQKRYITIFRELANELRDYINGI